MAPVTQESARVSSADASLFERIALTLETQGYAILPDALPGPVTASLLHGLAALEPERFQRATVGRGTGQSLNSSVRRDRILWIDENTEFSRAWLDWTAQLRDYLNRRLFLGLFSFESHFAIYENDDFYSKHLDAFRGESNRVLSLVTYLNKDWEPDQGGELLLYAPVDGAEPIRVTPSFGTLVVFLSEDFPHEVLPAQRERYSVAGWFRINNSNNTRIDPPR
jgi:SM-20-related protein